MLSILSSPPLGANTHKQTPSDSHTHTHTHTHTHKTILFNHRRIIRAVESSAEGNEANKPLYFPPSTPHVFLFSLLRQLLERMRRQERQTYGMINYRHRRFLCQQCGLYSSPLMSSGLLFFASIFSLSGLKRKTERVMVRRLCALCDDRVLSKK